MDAKCAVLIELDADSVMEHFNRDAEYIYKMISEELNKKGFESIGKGLYLTNKSVVYATVAIQELAKPDSWLKEVAKSIRLFRITDSYDLKEAI